MWSVVALAACSPNDSGSTFATCDKLVAVPAKPVEGFSGTVFTIALENHSRSQIFGNRHAPFINRLAREGAVAAGYHDPYVHPSEANYLWMVSGQNFGVLDDEDPAVHSLESTTHLADQIELAGLTWRSYQESMGAPCGLRSHGRYAAKHDPFVYFNDVNGWDGSTFQPSQRCNDHVVDYTVLDRDLAAGTVAKYVFITPNLDHDMHDGSVADGDAWLAHEVPKILASDAYKHGGVLFILWDEGGGTPARDDPPFIVMSPNAREGYVSKLDYDTSSYLKTVESVLGLGMLPCENMRIGVRSMDDLFGKPIHAPEVALQ
ncbi:MAG TPA: alkaline phosphatase family protein [Kofleriaceae bacterium]